MYYTPKLEEMGPGFRCQKIVYGEYDMEVCTPSLESYERYCLDDSKTNWLWLDHILTEKEYIELVNYVEGEDLRINPGIPILGNYRAYIK